MSPDDDLDADLRELARSNPRSGRAAQAKASALRTIERLERPQQEVPPMPEGWYPQEPGDAFYELDWVFLHEHPACLRRHWERAWREGRADGIQGAFSGAGWRRDLSGCSSSLPVRISTCNLLRERRAGRSVSPPTQVHSGFARKPGRADG